MLETAFSLSHSSEAATGCCSFFAAGDGLKFKGVQRSEAVPGSPLLPANMTAGSPVPRCSSSCNAQINRVLPPTLCGSGSVEMEPFSPFCGRKYDAADSRMRERSRGCRWSAWLKKKKEKKNPVWTENSKQGECFFFVRGFSRFQKLLFLSSHFRKMLLRVIFVFVFTTLEIFHLKIASLCFFQCAHVFCV